MAKASTSIKKTKNNNNNSMYLLYNLVSKEFKLKYRRSVLGVLWSLLNPLLMMIVMTLIFSNIFRFEFNQYPFAVYLILGQTIFAVFQDGTNGSVRSIIDASSLIKKVHVEKIIFPTDKVLFAAVNFAFSLIAIAAVMIFFGMAPTWKIILLPVLLILLIVFTLGMAFLISSLTVFFRDIEHLWSVLTTVWFYFTPIFWPYDALASNTQLSWVLQIVQLNPMYHFVSCFRQIMTGIALPSDLALSVGLGVCALSAVIAFLLGLLVFRKLEKKFILYI